MLSGGSGHGGPPAAAIDGGKPVRMQAKRKKNRWNTGGLRVVTQRALRW